MPKLHIRCIAGLELAFSVGGPIEDRDTSDKRAEAAILTPQKSSKKMAYAKTAGSLATDSNQHKVLGGPSGHNVKARNSARGGLESKMRAAKALWGPWRSLKVIVTRGYVFRLWLSVAQVRLQRAGHALVFGTVPLETSGGQRRGPPQYLHQAQHTYTRVAKRCLNTILHRSATRYLQMHSTTSAMGRTVRAPVETEAL